MPFAVAPLGSSVSLVGLAGRDLTSLPLEAAFAVRGGADESTALAALTIVPARILGLEDRIGSIEEGKDADLLILDGPPLDYRTYVETAIVDGKVRYDRAEDRVYPVFDRDDPGSHPIPAPMFIGHPSPDPQAGGLPPWSACGLRAASSPG